MKKKVSVKKAVKKTTKKTTRKSSVVIAKKPVIVESAPTKLRNFWKLFDKVKNHNFPLMVQRGNSLNDFVRVVEEMPEPVFQYIFVENANLTPIRQNDYAGCECPVGSQCFCLKYKTVDVTNVYNDYLKEYNLQAYEVEIQHLRHLIKLQTKGVAVPDSYPVEEFFKRSGAPKKTLLVNATQPSQTSLGVKEMVVKDQPIKMTQSSIDYTPEEAKKSLEQADSRKLKYKMIVSAIQGKSDSDDIGIKLGAAEKVHVDTSEDLEIIGQEDPLWGMFEVQRTAREELVKAVAKADEDKEIDLSSLSVKVGQVVETRPPLSDLKRDKNSDIQQRLQEYFDSDEQKFPSDSKKLKEMLKNLIKYAAILEDSAPKVTSTDDKLPPFWQDLTKARADFDKFSQFYARKYADYVDSLRDLNRKEQEYLSSDKPSDKHSLQNNASRHLNAQRDLEVLKKVLSSAYEAFHKSEISQVDLAYLQTEMNKYVDQKEPFTELFDHLSPNKEIYEKEMARRKVSLAPIFPKRPSPSNSKMRTEKDEYNKKPIVVESKPELHKWKEEIVNIDKEKYGSE